MLRISTETETDRLLTLRLEGQVVGPWVEVLKVECERHHAARPGRVLQLELSHTTYIDSAGRQLLRRLLAQGVALLRPSAMILDSLHEDGTG